MGKPQETFKTFSRAILHMQGEGGIKISRALKRKSHLNLPFSCQNTSC